MSQGNDKYKSKGFTLVELALSMGFVAALLIAVVLTVIQIGNIYNKGIILKAVDQVGRSMSNNIKNTISQSTSFSLETADKKYIRQTAGIGKDVGGRLCIGKYSYIWNYGKAINQPYAGLNKDDSGTVIKFVKVVDSSGSYCVFDAVHSKYPDIKKIDAEELLKSGDYEFAVHSFTISKVADDAKTKQTLYKIEFLLGTNDVASIQDTYQNCKPPKNSSEQDSAYCALNNFQLLVRSGNIIK